jgi:hypothetical protein
VCLYVHTPILLLGNHSVNMFPWQHENMQQ